MATIHTSHENKRGCGFRKGGGLYMVAGAGTLAACGKVPFRLEVCPTCGEGIKQTRGWTWVNARALFAEAECRGTYTCSGCPLGEAYLATDEGERMGVLWIGAAFYPTPNEYMHEMMEQGMSRRLTAVPRGFEVGKHWLLLAHPAVPGIATCEQCRGTGKIKDGGMMGLPDSLPCDKCGGSGKGPGAAIFTCIKPEAIEYVVKGDEAEEELDRLEERGIRLVDVIPIED
jgi:hypothetical protein